MAMVKELAFFLVIGLVVFCDARHIHPGNDQLADQEEISVMDLRTEYNGAEPVFNIIKPSQLSPLSSILFFKTYNPCEEGFERDIQGICREVWY